MSSPDFDPLARASYAHWVELDTRFYDLDALGHVNHARICSYIEAGRVDMLQATGLLRVGASPLIVIVRLEVDYRAEVQYPQRLAVGTRVQRLGSSSFTLAAALFAEGAERPSANSIGVCVTMDPQTRRSTAIPGDLRELLSRYA